MSSASLGDKSPGMFAMGPRERVGKDEVINAEASLLEGMASKEVINGFMWSGESHGGAWGLHLTSSTSNS